MNLAGIKTIIEQQNRISDLKDEIDSLEEEAAMLRHKITELQTRLDRGEGAGATVARSCTCHAPPQLSSGNRGGEGGVGKEGALIHTRRIQLRVAATAGEEFLVIALLHDRAVLHDEVHRRGLAHTLIDDACVERG